MLKSHCVDGNDERIVLIERWGKLSFLHYIPRLPVNERHNHYIYCYYSKELMQPATQTVI